MKLHRQIDPHSFTRSFSVYRLPTIIVTVGLIISILGFQMALKYDIENSRESFEMASEQVYRAVDSDIRRHEQQITAIGRLIGQIQNFSEEEFVDVSNAFTINTYFNHISLYRLEDEQTAVDLYPNANFTRKLTSIAALPPIVTAMQKAADLNATYLSETFDYDVDGTTRKLAAFVTPLTKKYRENVFLVGVLDLPRLFETAFKGDTNKGPVNVRVSKITPNDETLVFEQYNKGLKPFFMTISSKDLSSLKFERARFFEDYAWKITIFSAPNGSISNIGVFPWITLLCLMAVTVLLGYISFRITVENVRVHHLVDVQTESLRAYTEKLEQRNRDLDDFAYIASHDLKEPLRGISNYSEFLLEDFGKKLPGEGREMLETLRGLSARMEILIDNLLKYSRLSREDLNYKYTDMSKVVNESLETLSIMIKDNNVHTVVQKDMPSAYCDSAMIGEVYRNLITNAIKYNDKKTKMIELGYDRDKDTPAFFVRDNGIGVPENHKDTIFKIFKRLHGRDEFGGGTGSGLTIVKRVIDRHNGKIWIESEMGKGTTFFFTINVKKQEGDIANG